ncbi:Glycosyltransferase 36 [Rubrivivax sp. A210]|nr:Glycosyltransferase 36 [Rubrivivax sp. A210]
MPDAPAALRRLLAPEAGPLLAPVRSEIFGAQRFGQHGRSLGITHAAERSGWAGAGFFPRLRGNIRMLRLAQRSIADMTAGGYEASPASMWLLDNFHLIEAQLLAIHEGLPRSYFRALPVLHGPPLAGLPRVYGVAWAFVAHTDSAFDEDLLVHYLCAYQETRELVLSEMWALPTTLRVVLVENLRRLAERLATHKAAREMANLCCDRIEAGVTPALESLLGLARQRGVGDVFLVQLVQRLQDRASGKGERVPAAVRDWLQGAMPNPAAALLRQGAEQTADNLSVSNAVNALRAIGDADWPQIVARSSPLMQLMLGSPLFAAEHHATRDETLHGIERLARRSGRSEMQVARALLGLMAGQGNDAGVSAQPAAVDDGAVAGHWLQGPGRATLTRALGLNEAWRRRARAAWRHLVLPLYLGTVGLGSAALVAALLLPGRAMAGLAMALLAWPASEAVIALLHRLISESARPRHLPRLALAAGIPPEHRVLVVIPGMLSDAAAIAALVHRLELHWLANPEPQAQFGLLTDWSDAQALRAESDEALLAHASRGIADLNARRGPAPAEALAAPRFVLLHRRRSYSPSERRWIGWERKRGKLEQLAAELAEGPAGADGPPRAFVELGPLSTLALGTRYIVTLDSDTQLPPGRLRELVGVAAHPANRPRLSADGRRVVAGWGILQPRLTAPLPLPREDTLFHRMFAGQTGVDPYSAASSEVYQDLFEEGSFTGKGLLHVQAMHAVLGGNLPEGQVLSHDLLEGALARCAAVTDIALIEDAPFHAEVAASRVHRWTRGDWQLLPILLQSLLQPRRYPLGAVNRWKMADNLRRSLLAPMSLALLLLALAGGAVAPLPALALVLAAFAAGPLMGALAGFVASRPEVARQHFYRLAVRELARALGGGLWHLAMLLQHALVAVDAIVRALWRVLFSQRLLLQWTTAAAAQAAARGDLLSALRRHWAVPLVAAALAGTLWALDSGHLALGGALCLAWGAAPLWSWAGSRTGLTRQPRRCPPQDEAYLRGIARDTWRYFERCIGPADHHLPPDNLQTAPHEMLAHRTSPTNMGLYLLSVACARQFGWIDTAALLQRLQATLDTMERLPRRRGHFLNWYDTQSCAALLPLYVSTVDSGNLSGHLLAVAQACLELANGGPGGPQGPGPADEAPGEATALRLRELARRCETLAWEPDFSFLYHPRRHLLHIGWRVAEQQLDAGFYDLLASESRLTSLLAIAKGDVPVRHWAALGRPFHAVGSAAALRSWSGSMFEYLMPTLVLAEPHGSVLHEAGLAALVEQRAFAAALGVPWGISESAYAGCDHTLAYQYAPQGVPRLALRRTPPDELVIAPYATALAAQLEPHRAGLNYAALQALGARGDLGFIEALDFTLLRQTGSSGMTPVLTFMAHHQGMSIVALANVLLDGAPQRWGMANAHIEAVASLLHERAPREVSRLLAPPASPLPQTQRRRTPTLLREVRPGHHAIEPTHLLANGRYSVALRANGAGRSRLGGSDLTRWRDDALRDDGGSFFWLRREGGDAAAAPVSLTQHPAPDQEAEYRSVFHADRVAFETTWADLQARITVWVSPEDDIEFRQVELSNTGSETLQLELISAFEVVLADPRADEAHPAFGNLFVRAHCQPAQQALLFERRPRLAGESALHLAHFLAESTPPATALSYQVDRQLWRGRSRAAHAPRAALQPWPTGGAGRTALDTGLDPVCALAVRLFIAPGAQARLTFATAASAHEPTLQAVLDKYRQASHVARASLMSATLAGIRLRGLGMDAETFTTLQSLTTALMLSLTRPQPAPAPLCDRRLLWRFGLSGERPLVLVSAAALQGLGLVRALSQALSLWAWGGVACDLVVINAEPASYLMPLQRELAALRDRHDLEAGGGVGTGGTGSVSSGWHLLRADDLSADELCTLQALARVRLQADGRPLAHHLNEWAGTHELALQWRQAASQAVLASAPHLAHEVAAPQGRFADDVAGEFRFDTSTTLRPPRPWINVLANPGFGCHVSETGAGTVWALNSRLNQLTAWSNDAVADPASQWLLVQDSRTREVWNVAPAAWGAVGGPGEAPPLFHVRHGQGYTRISHQRDELEISVCWCVDADAAVRQLQLRIVNHGARSRSLRLVGLCEWMMGAQRGDRATVETAHHRLRGAHERRALLLATQRERAAGFGGGTAFLAWVAPPLPVAEGEGHPDPEAEDWTCDRREFFDARGRPVLPDHLGRQQGAGLDPCAALALQLELPAGTAAERVLLLGWAASPEQAQQLAAQALAVPAHQRLQRARLGWDQLLSATTVKTPDPLFDALVNRWLLYQTVACRLWAKAGFYQAGGATGFRDQLQDSMALAWAAPAQLREQILRCAARQFAEGDVQHWWHAPQGAGVRTHFSDDLLWLPHALSHYLRRSGDAGVLDEQLPFIESPPIPAGAEDLYGTPTVGSEPASVYEHAARTLDRSLGVGVHGLPLMGSGDWNDGMNRVGHQGRGESVWLAWFLCRVVADFGPVARQRGEVGRAQRWDDAAAGWRTALAGPAWDGQWYARAFFDDGQPLGAQANAEARIDLIAQAWSVLGTDEQPENRPERQALALEAAHALLVDEEAGLIRLLHPPLVAAQPSAGYIQAYPSGVRENGGQYSHAGVWALMALSAWAQRNADQADPAPALDRAWQYWKYLSPAHRAAHPTQAAAYGIEPYVMAGDVYSAPPYVGRGGWSWYTGSAAWMHRAAIESVFGLDIDAQALRFKPGLPSHWPRAELTLRRAGLELNFLLLRAGPVEAARAAAPWTGGRRVKLLMPGQELAWPGLESPAWFVVPLLPAAAA